MPHRHIDVRYIANLARLELSDEEVATFQPHLEAVLGHAETLARLDVSAVDGAEPAAGIVGRMRDDEPHESLPQDALLRNAPDQSQGQVRVPKVVSDV